MASKITDISELNNRIHSELIADKAKWLDFCATAGRLYKYPFEDQILIYAQRPDASACASYDIWNNKMNRYIKRGTKGIALIDTSSVARNKLRYVFDVSDTAGVPQIGRELKLWEYSSEKESHVKAAFERAYGIKAEDNESIQSYIFNVSKHLVKENIEKIMDSISSVSSNTELGAILHDSTRQIVVEQTLVNTIAAQMLSRFGFDRAEYEDQLKFKYLNMFNKNELLDVVGENASIISKNALMVARDAVMAFEKETQKNIETTSNMHYNTLKRESAINEPHIEKGALYGNDIQTGRGLPDTGAEHRESLSRLDSGEIRNAKEAFSGGRTSFAPDFHDATGNPAGRPLRDRSDGEKAAGSDSISDGRERGRERSTESAESNVMDSKHEFNPQQSRGDGNRGRSVPWIASPIPPEEEQKIYITGKNTILEGVSDRESEAPFFEDINDSSVITDYQLLDIIRSGGGNENSRERIYAKYQVGKTPSEMAEFIKTEIGTTGKGFEFNGQKYAVWYDESGLRIAPGTSAKADNATLYDWESVEKITRQMVKSGDYLAKAEESFIDASERKRVAEQIYFFFRDGIDELPDSLEISGCNYPDSEDRLSNLLSTHDGRNTIAKELKNAADNLENGTEKLRWKYVKNPAYLINEVADMDRPKLSYPLQDQVEIIKESFITQDEIDAVLTRGSGVSRGSFRIYEYFKENHDRKDNISFLKDEYGTGGRSDALIGCGHSWENHDAKGIRLDKGNITKPDTSVLLSWSVVAKRIEELIDSDKYLSPSALEAYKKYKEEMLQKEISEAQAQDSSLLDRAKGIINEFCQREYEHNVDFSDLSNVGLAYTDWLDEDTGKEHSVEVNLNLEALEMSMHIDGRQYINTKYDSLEDLINNELNYLSFDALVSVPDEIAEKVREVQDAPDNNQPLSDSNFRIEDNSIGNGTDSQRYKNNIEAIRLLKALENEDRRATDAEKQILGRYAGWGGLANAFSDSEKDAELKSLLTPDEYSSARSSTLNSHYTDPSIIKELFKTLEKMGFSNGNVLEPSCGIGNFFGSMPESMKDSTLYGVELDSISGRIARQLYPEAKIQIKGFEKTDFQDNTFDLVVGNVPFGDYGLHDSRYDKNHFLIHDYFFAKSLDTARPGGIVALITSKGTLDKESDSVRRYIAERADLIGSVRLPNDAFKGTSGSSTRVTSDIIFLKKLAQPRILTEENTPGWVHLSTNQDGIRINSYYAEHPEMIAGTMKMQSGPFGPESACVTPQGTDSSKAISYALSKISGTYEAANQKDLKNVLIAEDTQDLRNFSYVIQNGKLYFHDNSMLQPMEGILSPKQEDRLKGLIGIRDCTRTLIQLQLDDAKEYDIEVQQSLLNALYDGFVAKHGRINDKANHDIFVDDSSYPLIASLEKLDEDHNFIGKSDMFSKRTILKHVEIKAADTPADALAASLVEKGHIDFEYMSKLCDLDIDSLKKGLIGHIYLNPANGNYETADEYLSGNIREKLAIAKAELENNPSLAINVENLEKVMPKDLDASEIDVRLGATWIPKSVIDEFMQDIFHVSRWSAHVDYSDYTGEWKVQKSRSSYDTVQITEEYGTHRLDAYKILEASLNLKTVKVNDIVDDKPVLNVEETTLAQQKQEAIKQAFREWVFEDPDRRADLVRRYNDLFNSIRPREFDGSILYSSKEERERNEGTLPGMNPMFKLKPHQSNAVARMVYGDNTLLAHCVGAGKTFEMAAAAMEMKRLGLSHKPMFVVPSYLTEQWGHDFMQLYPGANILVATKKDFEPANRKKFCSRIATGDYDAVIIGHSQFEKIPLSKERQEQMIQSEIDNVIAAITEEKSDRRSQRAFTVKQLEKKKKQLEARMEKLTDIKQDDTVTFEELGVDRLFVDESHNFKNLALYTKMNNVAGISTTGSKAATDMYQKCMYIDEISNGKGITFASGTPISNSMCELYTNMRYLQHRTLEKLNLTNFDSWAASFGETQTAFELKPTGDGYRSKTRFAKFFNLPELINLFKECADIQTPDMLNLPVPHDVEYKTEVLKPSMFQKNMIQNLGKRADAIQNRTVDPKEDNMLKITTDGRRLALDQRLVDDILPDDLDSKINKVVDNAFVIWDKTKDKHSTQLIFCDQSTPHNDGKFNVYDDIKKKLIERGVPPSEIAYIHDTDNGMKTDNGKKLKPDEAKLALFSKVRKGEVRFLLGSTEKMGAGMNVQTKLCALHHVDVPWRPSDIGQREGRIIRQGNENDHIQIFRYVTEGTFDSYSWQILESKQKFISQIMTSKTPVRSCEDFDAKAMDYGEVKAVCANNPEIKEKMKLDQDVSKLRMLKASWMKQQYHLEDLVTKEYPNEIKTLTDMIDGCKKDLELYGKNKPAQVEDDSVNTFRITIGDKDYTDKEEAGNAILEICRKNGPGMESKIGEYLGFKIYARYDFSNGVHNGGYKLHLKGVASHYLFDYLGNSGTGNIQRIDNVLKGLDDKIIRLSDKLDNYKQKLTDAQAMLKKPFAQEQELKDKTTRLDELTLKLSQSVTSPELPSEENVVEEKTNTQLRKSTSVLESLHDKMNIVQSYEKRDSSKSLAPVI